MIGVVRVQRAREDRLGGKKKRKGALIIAGMARAPGGEGGMWRWKKPGVTAR